MKILMVSHYYSSHGGGIEMVAHRLSVELERLGHQVKWVATNTGEGLPQDLECVPMSGWNIIERLSGIPYPLWRLSGCSVLRNSIDSADIVHVHDGVYMSSQVCAFLARFSKRKLVLTQHVGHIPTKKKWLHLLMYLGHVSLTRHLLQNSCAVVFVSRVVRDFFRRDVSPGETLVIPNGVDPSLFHPPTEPVGTARLNLGLDPSWWIVLFVGRFVEKKGLQFIRRLAKKFTEVHWLFAGRGPDDPSEWHLDNVRVLGQLPQERLALWYRAADLLLLPSVGEGFPLVIQEAMACGLPCATHRETWLAWGEGKEHFIILEEHQLEHDLYGILQRARDRTFRARVAEHAAQSWQWANTAHQYESLYHSILDA